MAKKRKNKQRAKRAKNDLRIAHQRSTPVESAVRAEGVEWAEPSAQEPAASPTRSEFLPLDETLLDRANTQWQFGDWAGLAEIELEALHHHPDRAKLALLAAEGHLQLGQMPEARALLKEAQAWGVAPKIVHRVLIGGVYNTLGKASVLKGQVHEAMEQFSTSVRIAMPGAEHRLSTKVRALQQVEQLVAAAPETLEFTLGSREFAEALLPKPLNPNTHLIPGTGGTPQLTDTCDRLATQPSGNNHAVSLEELFKSKTAKASDKWAAYLPHYASQLSAYRHKPISLLEIGVQNGGSLEVWAAFFPHASHVIGCDINPKCGELTYENPIIHVVVGDATHPDVTQQVLSYATPLDVVIDDGAHMSSSIIKAFAEYFPSIAPDGLYIAEDLHCSYWPDYEGGLEQAGSAMEFFKFLGDLVNIQHWRRTYEFERAREILRSRFHVDLGAEDIMRIHSVTFTNSMAFVQKKDADKNLLGPRIIRGDQAIVWPEVFNRK